MGSTIAARRKPEPVPPDTLLGDYKAISKLPSKLFNPHRLLLLKILFLQGYADYRQLRTGLHISDGLLTSHLKVLEEQGYVEEQREFRDRRPRTTYFITVKGVQAFDIFRKSVAQVITRGIDE